MFAVMGKDHRSCWPLKHRSRHGKRDQTLYSRQTWQVRCTLKVCFFFLWVFTGMSAAVCKFQKILEFPLKSWDVHCLRVSIFRGWLCRPFFGEKAWKNISRFHDGPTLRSKANLPCKDSIIRAIQGFHQTFDKRVALLPRLFIFGTCNKMSKSKENVN